MIKMKAAIFDMDGTLVDSLMVWDIIWKHFGEKYLSNNFFKPDMETEKLVRTMTLAEAMSLVHEKYAIGLSSVELFNVANEVLKEFYTSQVSLKDGVLEFLDYCYNSGVRMCIVSATEAALVQLTLKVCGIDKYFSAIFSCATIGKGKEEPDIYMQALKYLNTPIEKTWVFEDSYTAIHTAHKLGIPTVGIYDSYNFDQEKIQREATIYIDKDQNLTIVKKIELCNKNL